MASGGPSTMEVGVSTAASAFVRWRLRSALPTAAVRDGTCARTIGMG